MRVAKSTIVLENMVEGTELLLKLHNVFATKEKKITVRESEIFAFFASKQEESGNFSPINTKTRQLCKEKFSLSSGSMSNYLRSLKEKGLITVHPFSEEFILSPIYIFSEDCKVEISLLNKE